jgi:hypothetical protein
MPSYTAWRLRHQVPLSSYLRAIFIPKLAGFAADP